MAQVKILIMQDSSAVFIIPFALDRGLGGGSVACGSMIQMQAAEFAKRGSEVINSLMSMYYTRDYNETSEFYETIPTSVRQQILDKSTTINIVTQRNSATATLLLGPNFETIGEIPFPVGEDIGSYLLSVIQHRKIV